MPRPLSDKDWERYEAQALQRHHWMMDDLIEIRKRRGITQEQVDEMAGWQPGATARLEDYREPTWDPYMSTIRMYALCVGALIEHTVYVPIENRNQEIT